MSTSWGEHDSVIRELLAGIDGIILDRFADAYRIMEEIYEVVREPEVLTQPRDRRRPADRHASGVDVPQARARTALNHAGLAAHGAKRAHRRVHPARNHLGGTLKPLLRLGSIRHV